MDLLQVEKRIGYSFKDKEILRRALTLASVSGTFNNQTLEFFGDAILEFIVSEKLFTEHPNEDEGKLTERRKFLVSDEALTPVSRGLNLEKYLFKSDGDRNNKKAVPSAYEAVVAAIYLDGGMDAAKKFVWSTLDFSGGGKRTGNFKGDLQEELQSRKKPLPKYECREEGTPQNPVFHVELYLDGKRFSAVAESRKKAEQFVAQKALNFLKNN